METDKNSSKKSDGLKIFLEQFGWRVKSFNFIKSM